MASRIYSALFLKGSLAASAISLNLTVTVPVGHVWILRSVQVEILANANAFMEFGVAMVGPSIPGGFAGTTYVIRGGLPTPYVTYDYDGHIVFPAGYQLVFTTFAAITGTNPSVTVVASGYDLLA